MSDIVLRTKGVFPEPTFDESFQQYCERIGESDKSFWLHNVWSKRLDEKYAEWKRTGGVSYVAY